MTKEILEEQKKRWTEAQKKLASQVQIPITGGYVPQKNDVILGLDIQYDGDVAHVSGDLSHWQGAHIGTYAGAISVGVPYISGFFCFREGPPLLALIAALETEGLPRPDLLIVDGHGLAHPRFFGAACWVGLATGIPTFGCAKNTLLHFSGELDEAKGSTIDVLHEEKVVGHVLRRIDGVRPVYVSAGHLLDLPTATQVAQELPSTFRIPDPIRRADRAAREHAKGILDQAWKPLGQLPFVPAPWD